MSGEQIVDDYPGLEDADVRACIAYDAEMARERYIELVAVEGAPRWCSGCGDQAEEIHDRQQRVIRHLPILDAQTWLVVPRHRLCCPRCGPRLERLSWLAPYSCHLHP